MLFWDSNLVQFNTAPSCFHKLIVNIEDPRSIKLNRMRKLPIWSLWQKVKLTVNAKLTERHEEKFLHRMAKVILLSESDMRDMYSIRNAWESYIHAIWS